MLETRTYVTDTNGSAFVLLRGPEDFATDEPGAPVWDAAAGVLRMPHIDALRLADIGREAALAAWETAPAIAEDGAAQFARLTDDGLGIEYALRWPMDDTDPLRARIESGRAGSIEELLLDSVTAPEGTRFVDLAVGTSQLAAPYRAVEGELARNGVILVDLDRRWQRNVPLAALASRVWVDRAERVWVASDLDLMLVVGRPLPQPYLPQPDRFEPIQIEPDPPRELWRRLIPDGWTLLSMAADAERLHLLAWREAAAPRGFAQAVLSRPLLEEPALAWEVAELPEDLPFAVDARAVGTDALVLMLPAPEEDAARRPDLPVVQLRRGSVDGSGLPLATTVPRRWPQPSQAIPRFTSDDLGRTRIVTHLGPRGLYPLAQARHAPVATATLAPLDTGIPGGDWHRLYLDACVPLGTSVEVEARAFDGETPDGAFVRQPDPLWSPLASELAFDGGRFAQEPNRQGLFEVQLQRDDGAVRRLTGRRLQLRLTLRSDGRHSPAIGAIRVYHPRNSWQEQFLPAHFRQVATADGTPGPANGADFRERLLASLEGIATPVENRIQAAECWLLPEITPEVHLDRLAAMLGARVPPHWPVLRRRRWIAATAELQQKRGTLTGLSLALDIVTDGAVSRGHVVPVETYRLRRTTATILGVDFDDSDHPLTLGTQLSGNSIVGPSLILSEETGRDFLALFAPELARTKADRRVVEQFFDRHAHRIDIVVHGPVRSYQHVIDEIAGEQVPAGVVHRILTTDMPFVLGLSPLLGIDTLLETSPAWRRVMLDDNFLGREGVLQSPSAFAPEAAGLAESLAAAMARTTGTTVEGDAR